MGEEKPEPKPSASAPFVLRDRLIDAAESVLTEHLIKDYCSRFNVERDDVVLVLRVYSEGFIQVFCERK